MAGGDSVTLMFILVACSSIYSIYSMAYILFRLSRFSLVAFS